jgi:hypothetical protein
MSSYFSSTWSYLTGLFRYFGMFYCCLLIYNKLELWFIRIYYKGIFKKDGKLLFLGLDDAGKTTLLNKLAQNRLAQPLPTMHASSDEMMLGNMKFIIYDLGGHVQGIEF